jgi:hypothetical protein
MRVRVAVACLLLSVSEAFAAPFAVQVGEARLALDAPPGFSDVQATGSPRLLELAESITSPSNRILLFALDDGDVRRFGVGDSPELRRYVIAVTPKGLERDRVTAPAFQAFVADSLRELGPAPQGGDVRAYLDRQPTGRGALLAELRRDPQVVSVLQGARASPKERRYLLSTTTLMLIRGKAVNLSVYTLYDADTDLDWIRAATARWIDDLQRLNNR